MSRNKLKNRKQLRIIIFVGGVALIALVCLTIMARSTILRVYYSHKLAHSTDEDRYDRVFAWITGYLTHSDVSFEHRLISGETPKAWIIWNEEPSGDRSNVILEWSEGRWDLKFPRMRVPPLINEAIALQKSEKPREVPTAVQFDPGPSSENEAALLNFVRWTRDSKVTAISERDRSETLDAAATRPNAPIRTRALLVYLAGVGPGDVHDLGCSNCMPLHVAVKLGNVELAERLMHRGADATIETELFWTPRNTQRDIRYRKSLFSAMHFAAATGQLGILRVLVESGVDVDLRSEARNTPLISATEEGQEDVVRYLLAQGADVNAIGWDGFTALHSAASEGHVGIASDLLGAGAEIEARDNRSMTPLYRAAQHGHVEIVERLIDAGADLDASHRSLFLIAKPGPVRDLLRTHGVTGPE